MLITKRHHLGFTKSKHSQRGKKANKEGNRIWVDRGTGEHKSKSWVGNRVMSYPQLFLRPEYFSGARKAHQPGTQTPFPRNTNRELAWLDTTCPGDDE